MGKRGPKPNPEKMAVLSTRIRADLRVALERARDRSGRTLSGEIEHRLRRTFAEDEKAGDQFGSIKNRRFMQMLALVMQNAAGSVDDWMADPWAYNQVAIAAERLLDSMRPPVTNPNAIPNSRFEFIWLHTELAKIRALSVFASVKQADASLPLKASQAEHLVNSIKSDLFEAVERTTTPAPPPSDETKMAEQALAALEAAKWNEARKLLERAAEQGIHPVMKDWWDQVALEITRKGEGKQ